jgi:hypothetical protein
MIASLALSLLASGTAPAIPLYWLNGGINNIGSDTNCISQMAEVRVQGYSGYTYWKPYQPVSVQLYQTPAQNEIFYAHLVLSHPGNPCAGSAVGIGIRPAAGTTLAISANNPVFCFARLSNGTVINLGNDVGYGCPQSLPFDSFSQSYRLIAPNGGFGGGSWGMAQGNWLEFLVPLRANQVQLGSNSLSFWVNPDIGVYGNPSMAQYVNGDVLFRSAMEDYDLSLDIVF